MYGVCKGYRILNGSNKGNKQRNIKTIQNMSYIFTSYYLFLVFYDLLQLGCDVMCMCIKFQFYFVTKITRKTCPKM